MAIDVKRAATADTDAYPILELNKAKEIKNIQKSAKFNLELTGGDYKTVIIMTGTSGKKVTFAIGDGIQGAGEDLVVTLGSTNPHAIVLDSGYFKSVSGDAKDCVTITPEAQTTFAVVELPQ